MESWNHLLVALLRYAALRGAAVPPRYMQGGLRRLRRTSTPVPRPLISHHKGGAADFLPYLVRVSGAGADARQAARRDRAAVGTRRKRRRRAAPARVGPAGAEQVRDRARPTTDRRLPPEHV